MREIKFRAWDRVRKEFLSAGNVFISINPGSRPLNSFVYLDLINHPDLYKERFVLEQYTGLRDKNGTEIYEGDIVEYMNGNHIFRMAVNYNKNTVSYILDDTYSLQHAHIFGLTVVGTIHSN